MNSMIAVDLTPAEIETIHRWADDIYAWQERLRFDYAGRNTAEAGKLAREAWEKGNMALRIMASLRPAREVIHASTEIA